MTHPPRCPKCGKPPPIRRLGVASGKITYQCCGKIIVMECRTLPLDTKLEENGQAA